MTTNFMWAATKQQVELSAIERYVERWHNGEGENASLAQFLGMTQAEYADWRRDPSCLPVLVERRVAMFRLLQERSKKDTGKAKEAPCIKAVGDGHDLQEELQSPSPRIRHTAGIPTAGSAL